MLELTPYYRGDYNCPQFGAIEANGHTLLSLAIEPFNRNRYEFRPNLSPEEIITLIQQLSTAVTKALMRNLSIGHAMQAWHAQIADEHQLRTLPVEAYPLAQEFNEILNTFRQHSKPPLFEIETH